MQASMWPCSTSSPTAAASSTPPAATSPSSPRGSGPKPGPSQAQAGPKPGPSRAQDRREPTLLVRCRAIWSSDRRRRALPNDPLGGAPARGCPPGSPQRFTRSSRLGCAAPRAAHPDIVGPHTHTPPPDVTVGAPAPRAAALDASAVAIRRLVPAVPDARPICSLCPGAASHILMCDRGCHLSTSPRAAVLSRRRCDFD